MARIAVEDVQAWVESTKLKPSALDLDHLSQIEEEVLARLSSVYTTTSWVDRTTTPRLVQVIISKLYAGWLYDKTYSENQNYPNNYARMVKANAEMLIVGIINGTIEIPGATTTTLAGASFYPNDASSAQTPTSVDPSLGPAKFSLGRLF